MYYTYKQSRVNSKPLIVNSDVANYVIIEADARQEADKKFVEIVKEYQEFSRVCGYRFNYMCMGEEPMLYYEIVYDVIQSESNDTNMSAVIYHRGCKENVVMG